MMVLVVTGGIGSGKSVVSSICRSKGFAVYDCDSRAKILMSHNESLRTQIIAHLGDESYDQNGELNRQYIADIIFNDAERRDELNRLVHAAVLEDIKAWIASSDESLLFIESAILYSSGIDKIVDRVWMVDADIETRIARVISRNAMSREEVLARIQSQRNEFASADRSKTSAIDNNGQQSLILQINQLIEKTI
jgi:dephospho-CoA kinase